MDRQHRTLYQIIFWLLVGIFLWYFQKERGNAMIESIAIFCYQIVMVLLITNVIAPKLLIQKKYLLFIGITLGLSFVGAAVIQSIVPIPMPRDGLRPNPGSLPLPPHPFPGEGRPPRPRPGVPRETPFLLYFLFISLSVFIATLIESIFFAFEKEKESIRTKTEHTETELKFLKSQINPHFLFNALNNIYSLSVVKSDKAPESISDISDMLRYVLYDCEKPWVSIRKEVAYINNYLQLFQLKRSKPFNIEATIEVEHEQKIAPMLLIPFVENSFKHSGIEQDEEGYISLRLKSTENEIIFSIKNSLNPNHTVKDDVGGIGLQNVKNACPCSILAPIYWRLMKMPMILLYF